MDKIYRFSFLKLILPLLILILAGGVAIFLSENYRVVGGICFVAGTLGFLFLCNFKVFLSPQKIKIDYGILSKFQELKWSEVRKAALSGDADSPSSRLFLHLIGDSNDKSISVTYCFFSNPTQFLQEVLTHLPNTCDVDPDLLGFAKEGARYSWKLFLKTDGRSAVILLALGILLLAIAKFFWP